LKLLAVAEVPDDDDVRLLGVGVVVVAVVVGLVAEVALKKVVRCKGQATRNTHEVAGDVDPELVDVDAVGPIENVPLVPSTALMLLCVDGMRMTHTNSSFGLPDLNSLDSIPAAVCGISSMFGTAQQNTIRDRYSRESNSECCGIYRNVIRDSECVVKSGIDQFEGDGRGVGSVGCPGNSARAPRRGILGNC
jgi:hypothetical protein